MVSLSIVTPSLNQAQFIESTIRSVLDQRYAPVEYIVCDGGSTDGTTRVLERYGDRCTVVSVADRGQADAVNNGIRATSGDIVGWLNSDDVYLPDALATVASMFAARSEVDVLYGDAQLIDAAGRVVGSYYTAPWEPARLQERCYLCQPAVFFRRRVVERFGLLDERLRYCMDYEYWLRLAEGGAVFAYTAHILAGSRVHADSKTLRARLEVHHEINSMLRTRIGHVPGSWLLNHAHTLTELRRAHDSGRILPYALEVLVQAARLSLVWNRSISTSLVRRTTQPIVAGAMRRLVEWRSQCWRLA